MQAKVDVASRNTAFYKRVMGRGWIFSVACFIDVIKAMRPYLLVCQKDVIVTSDVRLAKEHAIADLRKLIRKNTFKDQLKDQESNNFHLKELVTHMTKDADELCYVHNIPSTAQQYTPGRTFLPLEKDPSLANVHDEFEQLVQTLILELQDQDKNSGLLVHAEALSPSAWMGSVESSAVLDGVLAVSAAVPHLELGDLRNDMAAVMALTRETGDAVLQQLQRAGNLASSANWQTVGKSTMQQVCLPTLRALAPSYTDWLTLC